MERLEPKQLLSAASPSGLLARQAARAAAYAERANLNPAAGHARGLPEPRMTPSSGDQKPTFGYLVYRITNPNPYNNRLRPPFGHVLVQSRQPIPGQHYNVLYVIVRNGTAKSFGADSGFEVKIPQSPTAFPILTGDQVWRPGQWYIFYILTKKYYPMPSQASNGFTFNLGGARSVAIPGPSGIFLNIKYNPATINRTLDWIAMRGAGAQGGKGIRLGIPDTALVEFLSAKTNRNDFGGYF